MFIHAREWKFFTDDKEFRDSFYMEFYNTAKRICADVRWREKAFDKKKKGIFKKQDEPYELREEPIWFKFEFSSDSANFNIDAELFYTILYQKAEEFGYELKQMSHEGSFSEPVLLFMKPSIR